MRKRYLCTLACLLAMCVAGFALPNSSVLLQHKGFVTVYHQDSLNVALAAAVDGDTLFLSKGTYPGFTIDKKLTVRGAGNGETIITGMITIAIPDSVTLESTVLEGLSLKPYVNDGYDNNFNILVTKPLNNFKIKQCDFEKLMFERTMNGVVIDRCYCSGYLALPEYVRSLTANNSKIAKLRFRNNTTSYTHDSSKQLTFVNCNVLSFENFENFKGTFINSITGYGRTGSQVSFSSCSFINTLICDYRLTIDGTCYTENVWTDGSTKLVSDYNYNCMYSDEELIEKGYIGNDGTVIGCNGGATPHTLKLAVPEVTSADVKLDAAQRQLNVDLILGNDNE